MGFTADSSREALKRFYGNVQQAINMLESCGGALSSPQQLTQGKSLGLSLTGGWFFFLLFQDCGGPEKSVYAQLAYYTLTYLRQRFN